MGKWNGRIFLNENEVRGRADRQQGMKKTHLVAFVLDLHVKDLTDPIPAEDMIEIRDFTFLKIVNYAEKLDREMKTRPQDAAQD
jgi:nucleoid DNA-binding protein